MVGCLGRKQTPPILRHSLRSSIICRLLFHIEFISLILYVMDIQPVICAEVIKNGIGFTPSTQRSTVIFSFRAAKNEFMIGMYCREAFSEPIYQTKNGKETV